MNVKIAQDLLNTLNQETAENNTTIRLAKRWLQANMGLEYDRLIRVQILEGVAHVHPGAWSKQGGVRGLLQAARFIQDKFPDNTMNPLWLDPTEMKAYAVLKKGTANSINMFKLRGFEPDDIINSALTGLKLDPTEEELNKFPAYQLGFKDTRGAILGGSITPAGVAASGLNKAMFNRVRDLAKHIKEVQLPTDDDGEPLDMGEETRSDPSDAIDFMATLMFHSRSPLGRQIQQLMQETWANSPPMTLWLDTVMGRKNPAQEGAKGFQLGKAPSVQDVADALGIAKGTVFSGHWVPRWDRFFKVLFGNEKLRQAIANQAELEGIDADMDQAAARVEDNLGKRANQKVSRLFCIRMACQRIPVQLWYTRN